jgi:20S proteasome subunit alpha 1
MLKKKVSFTAETKLEDGGKELITDWEQDSYAYYEQKAAENDAKEAQEKSADSALSSGKQFGTSRKSKDALDYLNLYYRSRSSWKFNKNREVWILRHILSSDAIPTSFNNALASYVHGLGSKHARSRLVDQCQEALAKPGPEGLSWDKQQSNLGDMEDPARRKAYHDGAVRRFKQSLEAHIDEEQRKADDDDPTYQRWLSRRKRAEILLWAVTPSTSSTGSASTPSREVESESQSSTSVRSTRGGQPNGLLFNRKKKNRTAVCEATSSSEEESGSSDSGGDATELESGGDLPNVPESSSSADNSSSETSISESDSSSGAASATIANYPADSTPSSEDESEANKHHIVRRPQQSAISISSRTNTSPTPVSPAPDDTSSPGSTDSDDDQDGSGSGSSTGSAESDDDQDESGSGSGRLGRETGSSMNGDGQNTSSDDEEENSESDGD